VERSFESGSTSSNFNLEYLHPPYTADIALMYRLLGGGGGEQPNLGSEDSDDGNSTANLSPARFAPSPPLHRIPIKYGSAIWGIPIIGNGMQVYGVPKGQSAKISSLPFSHHFTFCRKIIWKDRRPQSDCLTFVLLATMGTSKSSLEDGGKGAKDKRQKQHLYGRRGVRRPRVVSCLS
jgi:hypothetical protein